MKKLKTLETILNKNTIPTEIKEMINSLNDKGKTALNDFYDTHSDFFQHAEPNIISQKLSLDLSSNDLTLYHYTNVESLKKIVESKEFYMKSIYYENDNNEVEYTFQLAKEELFNLGASNEDLNDFYKVLKSQLFDHYVWSFSLNSSSQALQNYGSIALGFSAKNLGNHLNQQRTKDFIFLTKVIYDKTIQLEYLRPVIRAWWYAYQNIDIDPNDMFEIMKNCLAALSTFAICFKNPILYQEEEVRFIVMTQNEDNQLHYDKKINNTPIISINIKPSLMKELIISHQADKDEEKIKKILLENKFIDTKIKHTKLPY